MRLLTETLAVCSCQRFLEVGGAIAFQTSTYEFDENLAQRNSSTLNKGQSWDAYKVIKQMTSGINSVLKCSLRIV